LRQCLALHAFTEEVVFRVVKGVNALGHQRPV
jgi:hypothetical protein